MMKNSGRMLRYVVIAVVAVGLIGWLTSQYMVKRQLIRDLSSKDLKNVRVPAARKLLEMEKLEDTLPAQAIIIRSKTAQALGEIGTDDAIRLLGVILKDQEEAPRRWAREALVKQGPRAISTLMASLSASGGTLEETVKGLQQIGPVAAPEMRLLLSDTGSYKGASQALAQMGQIGIDSLLYTTYAPDADLRNKALADLAALQTKGKLSSANRQRVVAEAIRNLGKDWSPEAGIKALGLLDDTAVVPVILPFLKTDKKSATATSLGLLGDARGTDPILATMNTTDKAYREIAIVALRRIVSKSGAAAYGPIVRDLKAPLLLVRRAAAAGLVGANTAALNGPLSSALQDPDAEVRASAASALGSPGNVSAIPVLVNALGDKSWRVENAAVNSLGAIGNPGIQPLLGVISRSGNATTNYQIAEAFVTMRSVAVDPLISALSNPSPEVQKWAVVALGEIRDQRALAPLERLQKTATGDLKWVVQEQLKVLAGGAAG
jgi:HEAT repeat protein